MPKHLKEEVQDRLKVRLEAGGNADLFDKIATEDNAEDPDALLEYLSEVQHPVLEMEPMF